jgi:hypothetical protein
MEGVEWEETLLYPISSNGDFFGTGMMALSEKQLYRKFCKVIEIPSIVRLDNKVIKDIQFYSRFLAIYISKMKKDWVQIDGNMKGQGRRNENFIHELKVQREDERNLEEINSYLLEHPECDFRKNDGHYVTSKAVYKEEFFGKKRKKRKRRFKNLWNNCPSLKDFKGSLIINRELILEKRKRRYQEEHLIYQEHVISLRENNNSFSVRDGSLKSSYVKPDERRQEDLSCESETQTLNQPSAVGASVGAVEHDDLCDPQIGRQTAGADCTRFLMVGTNSLDSVTDPMKNAEEETYETGFGKFYFLRDIYSISSVKKLIKYYSRRQYNIGCKCEM